MGFPLGLVNGQYQQNTQRQEEAKVEVFLPLAPRQVTEALSACSPLQWMGGRSCPLLRAQGGAIPCYLP